MLKKEDSNSVPEPDEYEFWEDGVEERRIVIQEAEETGPWQKESRLTLRFASDQCRELTREDNQVKPGNGDLANEYQHQYNAGPSSWQISMHMNRFLGDLRIGQRNLLMNVCIMVQWVDEFSKLQVNNWAAEFGRQVGEGILGDDSADNWDTTYDEWPPRVTLGRLLPHARGLGFKPRRGGFPSGAKKEWGLSPKAKVRVLHTAQLDVTKRHADNYDHGQVMEKN
nr:hypothetical protein [Tanacetum cinerariifolium]